MNRAYALLEIKSLDEEARTFRGIATTPEVDRFGDVLVPQGLSFRNPLPLLFQHDTKRPVGSAMFDAPTPAGIEFEASIPKVDEPGIVKDRTDEAWHSVKSGLIRGVSVGIIAKKADIEQLPTGGSKFTKALVYELSLTAVPVNQSATITAIRSIDQALRAANGKKRGPVVLDPKPGAPGPDAAKRGPVKLIPRNRT